jgi:lactoylglutathione lyase
MPKYWFDHVHLMSTDTVKTAEFYEKMFGAKIVSKQEFGEGGAMIKLDLNGTVILVTPARGDTVENGLDHFGIQTDDLKTAIEELKAEGVEFTMDLREISPEVKISFLKAPENVTIELQQGSL